MHRTIFAHVFFTQKSFDTKKLVRTNCTQKLLQTFTDRLSCTQKLYPEQFLHSRNFFAQKPLRTNKITHNNFYRQTAFTHRKFSAQKGLHLHTTFFTYRRFYAQMSLHSHRHKLHTETCAHSTRLHTANFYTERLYFPFLITYLSCSPSQLPFATRAMIHLLSEMNHQVGTRIICMYIIYILYIYVYIYVYIYMYYA